MGQHDMVAEVADGYARNFLLPNKLAELATEEKITELEGRALAREAKVRQQEAKLAEDIALIDGKKVTIEVRATEKGGLFKTLTPKEVARAIAKVHKVEISQEVIHLSEHIKTLGLHPVDLQSETKKGGLTIELVRQP